MGVWCNGAPLAKFQEKAEKGQCLVVAFEMPKYMDQKF